MKELVNKNISNLVIHPKLFIDGLIFKNHTAYVQIPKISFSRNSNWTVHFILKEYKNNGQFNFFFGERGGIQNSFVRKAKKIYYRTDDGSYIGGIDYLRDDILDLFVSYEEGKFTFTTKNQIIVEKYTTSAKFTVIGSGYNGKEFEEKTLISKLQIWNTAIDLKSKFLFKEDTPLQYNEYLIADWHFDAGFGCILYDHSGHHNHGLLNNTEWIGERNSILLKSQDPLSLLDWKIYLKNSYKKEIGIDFKKIGKCDNYTTEMLTPLIKNKTLEKGEKLLAGIFSFKNFNDIVFSEVIQWDDFENEDRNWQWQLHQWIFIGDLISAHSLSQNKSYLDKLFLIIDSWYEYYYNIDNYKSMAWQDHAVALRLRNLLYIWEYLQDVELEIDRKKRLFYIIETSANILVSNNFYTMHNNHGFDQSFILLWTALKFHECKQSETWKNISYDRLLDELSISFTSEGVHVENSTAYQVHMLQRLIQVDKLFKAFSLSHKITLSSLIENAFDFLIYMIQPNSSIPMFGDTSSDVILPSFPSLSHLDNYLLYQFIQSKGKKGKQLDINRDKVYPESGYAIFRDQWFSEKGSIQLVFKNTFLSTYHRHDDDLNFILQGLDEEWFVDGGVYKYDEKDQYRKYLRSAKSHNILVIPNADVSRLISKDVDKQSKITDYLLSEETSWVEAKSFMYTGYCVTRKIEYIRPNRFIITDKVDADTKETTPYELMFHIPMDKKIEIRDDNSIYISSQNSHELHMLFDGECTYSFEVLSGEDNEEVIGWQSKEFGKIDAIQTLRCHVVPAHNKAHSIVELTLKKEPEKLEKRFEIKIVSAKNTKTNYLDEVLKAALGFTEKSSLEYINKTLSTPEDFDRHFHFEDVLSIEELASKEEDEFNKQALNVVSSLRNKQVLLEFYQTGELILGNDTSTKAQFSITDGVCIYTFFSNGSEYEFWLAQRHHNISIFFISQKKIITLVENQMYINESINRLNKTLFNSFQKTSYSTKVGVLKKLNILASYSRPFHFFVDLIPAFLEVVQQISTKEIGLVYLDKDSFYPLHELHDFNFIENFGNIEDLNNALISNQSVLLKPVKDLIKNTNVTADFYKTLIDVASRKNLNMPISIDHSFVLWVSICAEKRTWIEQKEGVHALIEAFYERYEKLTVILDGMTAPIFSLKNEYIANNAVADNKLACNIIKSLPKINFVNAIGLKAPQKMLFADKVDFFVTSFLTESMYVARFSNKYGLAHGASLASPRQHRHPHTVILPMKFISDVGNTQRNWSVVSYSISPQLMVEWSMKILDKILNLKDSKYILMGRGFDLTSNEQRGSVVIKSTLTKHTYICIAEPYCSFAKNTNYSYVIYKEKYLFRFEAFSQLDSSLYIICYENNERVCTERLSSGKSKYIDFPENATHFRLFLRLTEDDEVEFFDVHWNTFSSVGSAKLGGYID